ncbi:MAG: helix-turn-helix domain-containing protein [Gemmatimonadota bacterium]
MEVKTKILEATLRVFAETGYRGATTRRIAQEADVNEVTLFRHFGSKDELIHAAVRYAALEEDRPRLPEQPADPHGELTDWARAHYGRMYARRAMIRTCIGESGEHPDVAGCVSEGPRQTGVMVKAYFRRLQERGVVNKTANLDVVTATLMSVLFVDAVNRELTPELFPYSREAAPEHYVNLVLEAAGVKRRTNGKGKRAK